MMSTPLLRELDPRAVALDACAALAARIYKMGFVLNPFEVRVLGEKVAPNDTVTTFVPTDADLVDGSDLGLTVQTLAEFAQRGCPAGDWTVPEMAADGLQSVVAALYGGALDFEGATPGILGEGEPETPLEAVLLAAWTRVQIGRGDPVEARQLALLTGETTRTVQRHIAQGELPASSERPARVPAAPAAAYLQDRGVALAS